MSCCGSRLHRNDTDHEKDEAIISSIYSIYTFEPRIEPETHRARRAISKKNINIYYRNIRYVLKRYDNVEFSRREHELNKATIIIIIIIIHE